MKPLNDSRTLILGAGPTGLGASHRMEACKADWALLEADSHVGGLSASFNHEGFIWDLGGHVWFSHYQTFDRILDSILGNDEWLWHPRISKIYLKNQWIPYPFQNNVGLLPGELAWECIDGLLAACLEKTGPEPEDDFEMYIKKNFGRGIARLFMLPYNRKVWGYPPSEMGTGWLGERVARPDIRRIIKNALAGNEDVGWGPNNMFRFPLEGGTGGFWHQLASGLPEDKLHLSQPAVAIDLENRNITVMDGGKIHYENLISTLPLTELARLTSEKEIEDTAAQLSFSSGHIIGFGLELPVPEKIAENCWMYFPEKWIPFYRATVLSNYSPRIAPEGNWSLMLEVTESRETPLSTEKLIKDCGTAASRAGLIPSIKAIKSTWHRKIKYAYPIPTRDRDKHLNFIQDYLLKHRVFSRGRFGAWKYEVGNMDHSFMQGVEVANHILYGTPELTVHHHELVNSGQLNF